MLRLHFMQSIIAYHPFLAESKAGGFPRLYFFPNKLHTIESHKRCTNAAQTFSIKLRII